MIDRKLNYGRHIVRAFLKQSMPFKCVMDLGAGNGADLSIAQSLQPSVKCIAVDCYEPNAIHLQAQGFEVENLDIERNHFPLGADVIIANQVLEHTKDIFWIFHQVSNTLPVGGYFLLGVPNLASLHNRLLLLFGRHPTSIQSNSAHVRGFTKPDVVQFVQSVFPNGYDLMGFSGSNFYPFPPFLALPLARLFPNCAWGIFFLFKKARSYNGEFLDYPKQKQLETNFYLG